MCVGGMDVCVSVCVCMDACECVQVYDHVGVCRHACMIGVWWCVL